MFSVHHEHASSNLTAVTFLGYFLDYYHQNCMGVIIPQTIAIPRMESVWAWREEIHERDKSRAQYLDTLKNLRRKADVERDNDNLRKENERLREDLKEARARALKASDEATDLWGQKETVEDDNRDLKRLVARLRHRLEELTRSGIVTQVKVEKSSKPPRIPTPSPSLISQSTAPEVINLIDDDDDMVVDTHLSSQSIGTASSPVAVKSEPSADVVCDGYSRAHVLPLMLSFAGSRQLYQHLHAPNFPPPAKNLNDQPANANPMESISRQATRNSSLTTVLHGEANSSNANARYDDQTCGCEFEFGYCRIYPPPGKNTAALNITATLH
ncbi:uncharacterized protein BT62DRAFT_1002118 [Guyanagaster necrorhizus]|uniref:Uncharacterized protein n=1 Tax=Guyanagaster necrorhizus TaxID=856835 RepID=A0A9P8AVQ2_9AGAR|nr:uncharacterized protein BT62DRAFT_1002118 [Guyanagaster necrorhizus MCA 3950]KAG7449809.1 hypothetical protein BT62DRAFT_1002118 [Guyanagaster necrorhizus MCA 3950]